MAQAEFRENYFSKRIHTSDPTIYVANAKTIFECKNLKRVTIGFDEGGKEEKIILVVGATGSGKSTLINGLLNYITGVKFKDDYRLRVTDETPTGGEEPDQTKSVTKKVIAYTIHHQPWFQVPYTLTVIDTPGYEDTRGIKGDEEITEMIRQFFSSTNKHGSHQIHVVGFVALSSSPRVTSSQQYIFESVLSLFGKDIEENIFMLLTHADAGKPNVLTALKAIGAPHKEYFKFNNGELFSSEKDEFNEMFWKLGTRSFRNFLEALGKVTPQSLVQTRMVLDERNTLGKVIERIHEYLNDTLIELAKVKQDRRVLEEQKANIELNKDFEYDTIKLSRKRKNSEKRNMNCKSCERTCCVSCMASVVRTKLFCAEIFIGTSCRVCSCSAKNHELEKATYVQKSKRVKETIQEMKKRHEEATGEAATYHSLVQKSELEIEEKRKKSIELIERARGCANKLRDIALRPNPMSIEDYIDLLIRTPVIGSKKGSVLQLQDLLQLKDKESLRKRMFEGDGAADMWDSLIGEK